jgi:hypothetical protein
MLLTGCTLFSSFCSLFVHLFVPAVHFLHVLILLPTYLPVYLPVYLPTYLPTYLFTCLPTYLPTYLPTNLAFNIHAIPVFC